MRQCFIDRLGMGQCCVEYHCMKVLMRGWALVSCVALMPASVAWIWNSSCCNIMLRYRRVVNSRYRLMDTKCIRWDCCVDKGTYAVHASLHSSSNSVAGLLQCHQTLDTH